MSKWTLLSRLGRAATDVATSKATEKVASTIVNKVGPHRALTRAGTIMLVIGIPAAVISWWFLNGWAFGLAFTLSAIVIVIGFALRGVNNLLVNLLVRAIKAVANRIWGFIQARRKRTQDASSQGTTKGISSKGAQPDPSSPGA